ncbi:hypothetical protein N7540_012985 [Penicillium herquei]|nr:hypothetical protein N7540_012985 [Penicillium herquei]
MQSHLANSSRIPCLFGARPSPVAPCLNQSSGCKSHKSQRPGLDKHGSLTDDGSSNSHHKVPDSSADTRQAFQHETSHKPFICTFPGCSGRFRRQQGLKRHSLVHLEIKPHVCWVPFCRRRFSRRDNLNAHYLTHGHHAGRTGYVATLDRASPVFDVGYRGRLTPGGWPLDMQYILPATENWQPLFKIRAGLRH